MAVLFRSGSERLVVGLAGRLASLPAGARPLGARDPPPAATARRQPPAGKATTGRSRAVWSGEARGPAGQGPGREGEGDQGPRGLRQGRADPLRELVVDPKTKGVAVRLRLPGQAEGDQPRGGEGAAAKSPKVELDQKNCEFIPYARRSTRTRRW